MRLPSLLFSMINCWRNNNRRAKISLKNISHFIVRFEKGYSRFYCERESETEQRLQYIDPHSYGHQRCVFFVLLMLNRRPGGSDLCWMMALFTTSYHQLVSKTPLGVPRAPPAGCGFPYHISSLPRLISNSLGGPKGSSAGRWLFLPHLVSVKTLVPNSLTSCLHRVI